MDVKDYRQAYERELTAGSSRAKAAAPASAAAAAPHAAAIDEISRVPQERDQLPTKIPSLIATLRDQNVATPIRQAALRALRAVAFLAELFAPFRAEFLDALRQIAKPDTDQQLRQDALEILSAEKDPYAQDLLKKGLENEQDSLVPAVKALQFLRNDDHGNFVDIARDVFQKAQDVATKVAALRIMATDAKSRGLLEQLLQDKTQPQALRTLSATGLHFLDPQKFAEVAQKIILDKSDFEDIRATALGALANAPDHQHLFHDTAFIDAIKKLGSEGPLQNLHSAVGRFMSKL
ncbi:MAG: hypothetical protein QOH65_2993 [Methylobacteriaceae bacterium]|jgi:hypothetical protein|nr:hypothetical protein [Methylobacteriaceae bacterium]